VRRTVAVVFGERVRALREVVGWAGVGARVVGFAAGVQTGDVVREGVVLALGAGTWEGLEGGGCGLCG
jgi:hypothetical protein